MSADNSHPLNMAPSINSSNEIVAEIIKLKKSFGAQEVLKNVSFNLLKGENLVVLGKSGSGKSVLIKCFVRLMDADEGTINVFGKDVSQLSSKDLSTMREKIGFLFQSGALYDSMTVKQNLEFYQFNVIYAEPMDILRLSRNHGAKPRSDLARRSA